MNSGKKKDRIQGKTSAHTKLMIKSQVIELVRSGKIKTTPSKAKVLKANLDRLISYAQSEDLASDMKLKQYMSDVRGEARLRQIAKKMSGRKSGYTRIVRTLPRKGDNAQQVYVMLVDFEESSSTKKSTIQKTLEKQTKSKKKK